MRNLILNKISKLLNSRIDTEAKTQYLLVQVHKVRKLDGKSKSYLDFFRDWLVHDEISYRTATDFFLNKFETYVVGNDAHKIAQDFILNERNFFEFISLKTELRNFLVINNLSTNLTDNTRYWLNFVRLLVEILKECPVKCANGKIDELTLTEDVSGNICFRFHLRGRRDIPKVKLKIKGL